MTVFRSRTTPLARIVSAVLAAAAAPAAMAQDATGGLEEVLVTVQPPGDQLHLDVVRAQLAEPDAAAESPTFRCTILYPVTPRPIS